MQRLGPGEAQANGENHNERSNPSQRHAARATSIPACRFRVSGVAGADKFLSPSPVILPSPVPSLSRDIRRRWRWCWLPVVSHARGVPGRVARSDSRSEEPWASGVQRRSREPREGTIRPRCPTSSSEAGWRAPGSGSEGGHEGDGVPMEGRCSGWPRAPWKRGAGPDAGVHVAAGRGEDPRGGVGTRETGGGAGRRARGWPGLLRDSIGQKGMSSVPVGLGSRGSSARYSSSASCISWYSTTMA